MYLVDVLPQVEQGEIQYLIEGGVAVYLVCPERAEPGDVDFIYREANMSLKYHHLPSKSAVDWLESREIPGNEHNIDFLFANSVTVNFKGKNIHILNPVALAFSKSVPCWGDLPRAKDLSDVDMLKVTEEDLELFKKGFTNS